MELGRVIEIIVAYNEKGLFRKIYKDVLTRDIFLVSLAKEDGAWSIPSMLIFKKNSPFCKEEYHLFSTFILLYSLTEML